MRPAWRPAFRRPGLVTFKLPEPFALFAPNPLEASVFAQRYGCDAELASLLIFSSVVVSAFTVLGVLLAL